MNLLFSLINPYNIIYLLLNKPISYVRIKCSYKYYLQIISVWSGLVLIFLLAIDFGKIAIAEALNNFGFSVLFLILIMQTLSIITIPLKLYRVYLTKTSIVQTWWFIKLIEIKRGDIFAIDINKQGKKLTLHVFIVDRLLGNVVMERIISDPKSGFYIEPSSEFVQAIKVNVNNNSLTKDVINYPNVSESSDLRNDIYKLSKITLRERGSQIIYFLLLLLHPITVFFILEIFNNRFILNTALSTLAAPFLEYFRRIISDNLSVSIRNKPEMEKIYEDLPIEEKMQILKKIK